MNQNIMDQFILDLRENGVKMDGAKLVSMLQEIKTVIEKEKDYTKEELIQLVLQQFTQDVINILNDRNLIPGYNVALKVGNIEAQVIGGHTSYEKTHQISEQTIFDIASCSKLFTQIIAYNLISEGVFTFDTKVRELDSSFVYLQDLTIGDITRFETTFKTPGRIDDCETTTQAFEVLYNTEVAEKNKYNYNDIGMIILKEVMETVTKKSYEELFDFYITSKLHLQDTFVKVPENRYVDLTATPNSQLGFVNDPKAVIFGGYSGHAGVTSNAKDLLTVGNAIFEKSQFVPMVDDVYTKGKDTRRGIMGNTYVYHEQGIEKSFVSNNESTKSFRVQGSTRNVFGASKFILKNGIYVNSNAILLNPASMSIDYAKTMEEKINENALQKWIQRNPDTNNEINFRPNQFVKKFHINGNNIQLIDPRSMVSLGKTSDPMTEKIAEVSLKLMFLDTVLKAYETAEEKEKKVSLVYQMNI